MMTYYLGVFPAVRTKEDIVRVAKMIEDAAIKAITERKK
jgi:hypothetical protein